MSFLMDMDMTMLNALTQILQQLLNKKAGQDKHTGQCSIPAGIVE